MMWRIILFCVGALIVIASLLLATQLSQGAMDVIAGLVVGIGITIVVSLVVIAGVGDRMSAHGAGNVYYIDKAVFVTDVRRLADSGAVMTLADRHAMEVRR